MYIIFSIIFVFIIFFFLFFHFRKKRSIQKICQMSCVEKCELINELVEPFGYSYDACQDIFSTRIDAWQKNFGYSRFYDRMAPLFHMIFDSEPIYFDYDGKTWLIELWKGQYGITTGSEIGVYYANRILSKKERKRAHYQVVAEKDYLQMESMLFRSGYRIATEKGRHWWQTMFVLGMFSKPKELMLRVHLIFPDFVMRNAFLDALLEKGYCEEDIRITLCNPELSFMYCCDNRHRCLISRLYRRLILWYNGMLWRIYCFMTRKFSCTYDRVLYLYYLLPFAFRRILRFGRRGRMCK